MTHDARRTKLYKWAIGLSIIYVADGALMAVALFQSGYAWLGYVQLSYFPVFFPALLAGLVVSGMYWRGFTRHHWTARKAEWVFFFLLAGAVLAKVIVVIHAKCCH